MTQKQLTWGEVMVAAMAAACATSKDSKINHKRFFRDVRAILKVMDDDDAPRPS